MSRSSEGGERRFHFLDRLHLHPWWLLAIFAVGVVAINFGRWDEWGPGGFRLYLTQAIMQTTLFDYVDGLLADDPGDDCESNSDTAWASWEADLARARELIDSLRGRGIDLKLSEDGAWVLVPKAAPKADFAAVKHLRDHILIELKVERSRTAGAA